MKGRVRIKVWFVLMAVMALIVAGCGGGEEGAEQQGGGSAERGDIRIAVKAPQTFDMVKMSQLIDAAVASEPDGLVVSIPDADALRESIQKANEAGIPIVSINSGSDVSEELGALTHVGQTEFIAGEGAGERLAEEGVDNALCINQEVGNVALDQRCEGFEQGLGGEVQVVAVDLTNPTDAQAKIETAVSQNPDINGMLALGPTGAEPALKALRESGRLQDIQLATFDLAPSVLEAIRDGDMVFAVDHQQYLQGYLPIVFLTNYAQYGVTPTSEVAQQVINLSKKGIR